MHLDAQAELQIGVSNFLALKKDRLQLMTLFSLKCCLRFSQTLLHALKNMGVAKKSGDSGVYQGHYIS